MKRHGNEYVKEKVELPNDQLVRNDEIHEQVHDRMADQYEKRRQKSTRAFKMRRFKIGDEVLVPTIKLSNKSEKFNQKLGPSRVKARIVGKVGESVYLIKDMKDKELGKIHSKHITIQ